MKDNDNDLLDFEAVNPLDAISDDEGDEDDDEEIEITKSLVKKWNQQLDKPTPKITRNILIAFKAAVNIHNSDSEDYKFSITDPKAFSELMLLVLKKFLFLCKSWLNTKLTLKE